MSKTVAEQMVRARAAAGKGKPVDMAHVETVLTAGQIPEGAVIADMGNTKLYYRAGQIVSEVFDGTSLHVGTKVAAPHGSAQYDNAIWMYAMLAGAWAATAAGRAALAPDANRYAETDA